MMYLSMFFLLLCGLTYFILTTYFEIYYTQSRTEALMQKTREAKTMYNQSGLSPELQSFIDNAEEEGTVIQVIQKQSGATETVVTTESLSDGVSVSGAAVKKTVAVERLSYTGKAETLVAAGNGKNGAEGETTDATTEGETGHGTGSGSGNNSGNGSGSGTGKGSENEAGHGNGSGQGNSVENQVADHSDGESFVIVLGNTDRQVEWLTYKEIADDGSQIVGRIPLYSVHDVVKIVSNFLLVFLVLVFGGSLIFAYFFARGISRPIINLNRISREMGNLKFDEKYTGSRKDEIGQLGETLNHISDELENAITKLQEELNKERAFEKMRQRFTAQVSHEIQTPLAVIKSYAEALEDGMLESREEEAEYFVTIQKEADKISGIASDLLDLAQIESGAYQLKKETVSGSEVIASVVERFVHTYPDKKIVFENDVDENLMISMDRKRMEQVFYNLLNNAIKHVNPPDGLIRVGSWIDQNQWIVSVYNVGNIIPEHEIDQIWEYFYKAKTDKKGTGLGLAIVKGIILCHGGEVVVDNREEGVEFEVAIPR
jgi:signal transduction histidine kinase